MFIDLTIDSLSYHGGRGVGRHEGRVVFVPFTAPGDIVKVKITADKGRFLEGEIVEVLSASEKRREPPCEVFGHCGGCRWQHIEYAEQLIQKQNIIKSSFRTYEKKFEALQLKEIIPADSEWNYRNRVQLHSDGKQIGFYKRGSRDVVAIENCKIAESTLNDDLKKLIPKDFSGEQKLEIALTEDQRLVRRLGSQPPESSYFSQVNTAQNRKLIDTVLGVLQTLPESEVLDLYCGAGNFTFPIADLWPKQKITGIELSAQNIAYAKGKSKEHHNIEWETADVARYLKKLATLRAKTVVLDPPRLGCDREVIAQLLRLQPENILYISCNPTTLARDLSLMRESGRYVPSFVQGFDMFPQTEHVECLSLLRRRVAHPV